LQVDEDMTTTFTNSGPGEQNIAQGDHAIGKQVNNYGISPEVFAQYVKELGATEQVIRGFLSTLLEHDVPREQWDSKLREIATRHKELLARVGNDQAAKQAIEAGDYAKAEELLEDAARRHTLAAAEANAAQARLQDIQWHYAKAAAYWQKAAALLPEESKKERALYLNEAGYNLYHIGKHTEAVPLYEQSLAIRQEIGDRAGEGVTLNNISQIHTVRGEYATALIYLEQSLSIDRELGDRAGEGVTLNNISQIHTVRGEYATALIYLEQSLSICREVSDKAGEACTLNNISEIHRTLGEYATALHCLEQSLSISREIGNKYGEAVTSWNIGYIYEEQGGLAKVEPYMSRAVQLAEEIGHLKLEYFRKGLERVRAKLQAKESAC
jgi:tetratricopeptide (TPR) repeat protein